MKTIDAGELTHRIDVIERRRDTNAGGYGTEEERLVCRRLAKVTQTGGSELVKANADFGQTKVRFLIRWTPVVIDRKMIVRWRGLDYEIEYVNDYASRRYIEIWGVRLTREGS
jgi:head-tail adaptor